MGFLNSNDDENKDKDEEGSTPASEEGSTPASEEGSTPASDETPDENSDDVSSEEVTEEVKAKPKLAELRAAARKTDAHIKKSKEDDKK